MSGTVRLRSFALALVVLGAAACGGSAQEITTFDDVPTEIVIDTATGNIIINADVPIAGVQIESDVSGTEISSQLVDGVLTISDDCGGDGCNVNYFIQMRGDLSVQVTTVSGSIAVSDINGDVALVSETGAITVNAVTGSAVVTTNEANIIATRMASALAEFRADIGNIDVTFDQPVEALVAVTNVGDVTAQLPDGSYAIEATTENGSTDLTFESDPGSDKSVSLTTGDGDITVYSR